MNIGSPIDHTLGLQETNLMQGGDIPGQRLYLLVAQTSNPGHKYKDDTILNKHTTQNAEIWYYKTYTDKLPNAVDQRTITQQSHHNSAISPEQPEIITHSQYRLPNM